MGDTINILEVLEKGLSDLKEQKLLEEKRMDEIKERAFNFNDSLMSDADLKFAEEISNTFFDGIANELTPEQKGQLQSMSIKQRISTAGAIWGSINSFTMAKNFAQGNNSVDVKGIISKVFLNPMQTLAIGNVIYKGIQDFKDGVTTGEIFTFIKDGAPSVISAGKFIHGLYQIKTSPDIPGTGFLDKMKNYYFDTDTVNIIKPKEFSSYTLNLDTKGISLQRYLQKSEISDIVALPDATSISGADNITGGTFKPLDGVDDAFKDLNVDLEVPKTGFEKIKGAATSLMQYADIAMQVASLTSDIYSVVDTVNQGKKVTPSQIMSIISSSLGTIGSAVSFAGPIGQVVGVVISGVGSLVSACKSFAELNSESSTKDVLFAINDFMGGLVPILPSLRAIDQAMTFENLKNTATNETDRKLYTALHKMAALDATPIINFTKFIYEPVMQENTRKELLNSFGSFDNMMKSYITNDTDFSNNLNEIGKFLKNNANTEHTQFITGYLTPEQVKSIFGEEEYYKSGYDVKNVDTDMMVFKTTSDGTELEKISGMSVTPMPNKTTFIGGRHIINNFSLGYGFGKSSDGVISLTFGDKEEDKNAPRRVDTSTYFGYTKQALEPYKAFGVPLWVMLEDDMSGKVQTVPQRYPINNINNRVRVVATDVLHADVRTGNGSDDVIITDVIRAHSGTKSSVKAIAMGGQGDDVLDLSHMMADSIKKDETLKDETFNWKYDIYSNELISNKEGTDGHDHFFMFNGFETMTLTDAVNTLEVKEGTDVMEKDGTIRDLRFSAINGTKNTIDFEGIKSSKLMYEGGADADNSVLGTENNDFIQIQNLEKSVGKGKHIVKGMSGNDFIKGGNVIAGVGGLNDLQGGAGDDIIVGNGDNNILNGGSGNDMIFGSNIEIIDFVNSKEVIDGGDGDDYIEVGGKENTNMNTTSRKIYKITGGNGNDTININNSNFNQIDVLDGGEGNDTLDFSKCSLDEGIKTFNLKGQNINAPNLLEQVKISGFENVVGTKTNDFIFGNAENNMLKGNSGNDYITGDAGNDTIYGDTGNDRLNGEKGTNYLFGGEGNDTFESYKGSDSFNFVMDFESNDKIVLGVNDMSNVDFNRARVKDSLTGKITDSLLIKTFENNVLILNDYYNSGHAKDGFNMNLGRIAVSKEEVAKKVIEAKFIDVYGNVVENVDQSIIVTTDTSSTIPMTSLIPAVTEIVYEEPKICVPGQFGA